MKINRRILTLVFMALLTLLPASSRAQDTTTSDSDTNAAPTLKDLMAANDQITNTVGMVLVKISSTEWVGMYEVTQDAYQQVVGSNPSAFPGTDHPVDSVTWNDAMAFCKKLTASEQKADQLPKGFIYTLLTQAQWEKLVDDTSLSDAVMSLNGQRHSSTESVGSLGANSYGLYDMRGNVMEWCLDPQDKPYRVLRGGAWDTFISINARVDFREYSAPDKTKKDYGFRVVLEPKG
ncbi:MAG TPA: SUMF1/EgtB/PvdO family nonheme iron enzyme [Verrucomicrobiae bacterium]|nr:SUMF1/EgtB/PvdO family nonheme iron enzyme [Verrucomicrobiae bacterium]